MFFKKSKLIAWYKDEENSSKDRSSYDSQDTTYKMQGSVLVTPEMKDILSQTCVQRTASHTNKKKELFQEVKQ